MMLLALPSEVGYQDLATLLTRQPVVNRAQKTAFASAFAITHEAPYDLPEPVGRRSRSLRATYWRGSIPAASTPPARYANVNSAVRAPFTPIRMPVR